MSRQTCAKIQTTRPAKSCTGKSVDTKQGNSKNQRTGTRQGSNKNQRTGKLGEDLASRYLEGSGFSLIERNWKCSSGEADIIAEEDGALVFIEVKTRTSASKGLPEDAVTRAKRAKYERIAISYLTTHRRPSSRVRFDVIAIVLTGEKCCLLRHHRDAFAAGE